MTPIAYIAIGSNLGDRRGHCDTAVEKLCRHPQIELLARSQWREYPALTRSPDEIQPPYVNGAIKLKTDLTPETLLEVCQDIEVTLGRVRSAARWSPRTIDIDLIGYDDLILQATSLTLPHPELHKRRFVLEPLNEIAPEWQHPLLGKKVEELLMDSWTTLEVVCSSS